MKCNFGRPPPHFRPRSCNFIMPELTAVERGQNVMLAVSASKVGEVLSASRGTVLKINCACLKFGETLSAKSQRRRNSVLSDCVRSIVTKNKKITAAIVTYEMNVVLTNSVSTKTERRELHKQDMSGLAAIQNNLSVMIIPVTLKSIIKAQSLNY